MTQLDLQFLSAFSYSFVFTGPSDHFFRLGGDILQFDTLAAVVLDHEHVLLDRDLGGGRE